MYKVPTPCLISSPFFFSFDAVYWSKDTRHLASNWYFTIRKNGLFFLPFLPWVHHAASYNQTIAEWRCRSVKVSFSWVCGNHRPPFWGGEFTLSSWSDAMTSFRYIYIYCACVCARYPLYQDDIWRRCSFVSSSVNICYNFTYRLSMDICMHAWKLKGIYLTCCVFLWIVFILPLGKWNGDAYEGIYISFMIIIERKRWHLFVSVWSKR